MIPENDPFRLLSQLMEDIDLIDLYSAYQRVWKNHLSSCRLLKSMLYALKKAKVIVLCMVPVNAKAHCKKYRGLERHGKQSAQSKL